MCFLLSYFSYIQRQNIINILLFSRVWFYTIIQSSYKLNNSFFRISPVWILFLLLSHIKVHTWVELKRTNSKVCLIYYASRIVISNVSAPINAKTTTNADLTFFLLLLYFSLCYSYGGTENNTLWSITNGVLRMLVYIVRSAAWCT